MKKRFALLMVAILLLSMGAGTTYAKYVKQDKLEGSVTIKASLGSIKLVEHQALRQADGSYELIDNQETDKNTYILLPGLDVDKDPTVHIKEKTPIDCYVYLKVVTNLADSYKVQYTVENVWKEISRTTQAGETTIVYVYTAGGSEAVAVDDTFGTKGTGEIPVLVGNKMIVSQKLDLPASKVYLNFFAYMFETSSGTTAESVYANNTTTP